MENFELLHKMTQLYQLQIEKQRAFFQGQNVDFSLLKDLTLKARVEFQGSKLLVDPFSRITLQVEIEGARAAIAWKLGKESGYLHECQTFVSGMPSWMVLHGVARQIAEELPRKWIKRFSEGPQELNAKELAELMEECEGSVLHQGPVSARVDPIPFLVLADRHGAFADLWLDYGAFGKVALHDPCKASWREPQAELAWEKDLLETDFIRKTVEMSHYYCPLDRVCKSLTFLLELGWRIFDAKGRAVLRQKGEDLTLLEKGATVVLRGKVQYEAHEADVKDVVGSFNRREQFVELSSEAVGLIDRRYEDLATEEIVSEGIALSRGHVGLLSSLEEQATPDFCQVLKKLTSLTPSRLKEPGPDFQGELFSYQSEGLQWLGFLEENQLGGVLADEMGLGKTVQVLAFFSQLSLDAPSLIAVPTSLIFHWEQEIRKFLPTLPLYVHHGEGRVGAQERLKMPGLVLTSHALLRQEGELLQSVEYQCALIDEAQVIKNAESQIAKAAFGLRARMRLAITGTPVENRSEDLWSLFHFAMPGLLGEQKEMRQVSLDERFSRRVKKKVKPFLLRRKKSEVALQLPPKFEQLVYVEMPEEQRAIYDAWLTKTRKVTLQTAAPSRMQVLEAILRLRQIASHPLLVEPEAPFFSSGKFERLFSDLTEVVEEGSKVLVYSQFTQMLQLMKKELQSRGIPYVYLDGSSKDREETVRKFQEDPKIQVFLISLKAGGVGLNLTAADYVFIYDPWWNDAVENQAIDRAHRVGKKSAVIARRYVTAMSIEEKILHLKSRKRSLSESLLDEEAGAAGTLSLEELLALIN